MRRRLKRVRAWLNLNLNRVKLPVMQGLGLYSVLKFFWHGLKDPSIQVGAMAMAYRFFFSLFPGLMILFTIASFLPVENVEARLFEVLGSIMPAQESLSLIKGITGGSGAGLFSINLLLLLISAVGAVKVMIHAFYRNDEFVVRRTFLRFNLAAFGIFFLLMLIFILTAAILIGGEVLISQMAGQTSGFSFVILRGFHIFIVLLSLILAVSVLYYFGPQTESQFSFISPGSVMGGILIYLAILLFRLFVNYFFNYELYASLSAIMVLMVWFLWISYVVLVGFELNRAIARLKRMQLNDGDPVQGLGE